MLNVRISLARVLGAAIIPIPIYQKITTWDPGGAFTAPLSSESATVYESVLGYAERGDVSSLAPVLLSKMPERLDGGKRYRLTLKSGARFDRDAGCLPDGRELIASDVVYSWKRLLDPKNHFGAAWALDGLIEDLVVKGPTVVDIILKKPLATFLYRLAMPGTAIVARECVEKYGIDFARNPVGTGPFRLVRSKTDFSSRIVYEARSDYHVPGLPRSGGLEGKVFLESQPRWLSLESGSILYSGVPKQAVPGARNSQALSLRHEELPNTIRLSFNMDSPVVGAVAGERGLAIRRLLSAALPRDEYVKTFLEGEGLVAYGPVPPGVVGYAGGIRNAVAPRGPKPIDPPVTLEFNCSPDANSRQFAEWMTLKLAPYGINIKPVYVRANEWRARIEKRQGDLWFERWNADYPDAENFLQLYYGKNKVPGSNDSGYQNPAYDALYEKLLVTDGAHARAGLSLEMQKMLLRDAPAVWLAHERMLLAYRAKNLRRKDGPILKGQLHPFDFMVRKYWGVD